METQGLWLTRDALAEQLGIDADTVTRYVHATRAKRDRGEELMLNDFPLPFQYIGRTPVWTQRQIDLYRNAKGSANPLLPKGFSDVGSRDEG